MCCAAAAQAKAAQDVCDTSAALVTRPGTTESTSDNSAPACRVPLPLGATSARATVLEISSEAVATCMLGCGAEIGGGGGGATASACTLRRASVAAAALVEKALTETLRLAVARRARLARR